ncbi:hypothetical protein TNIN_134991 [Trichonephila inaurata madagascariensis]|uniref:Uncharacterized protein n=1 Tax=Trichonephila inaurata madagascariensis TaxID=2747483 RepID=A0A8X6XYN7_9ARAC|nr:hypothetical protein TNIN_134991 [Trichonephila inaurata madagascariensis]
MEEFPSLNEPAAKYDANSTIFSPECKCLGANRQIVELKLSFAFFVCGHLNSSPVNRLLINLYILEEFPSVCRGKEQWRRVRFTFHSKGCSFLPLAQTVFSLSTILVSRIFIRGNHTIVCRHN